MLASEEARSLASVGDCEWSYAQSRSICTTGERLEVLSDGSVRKFMLKNRLWCRTNAPYDNHGDKTHGG